VRGEASGVDLVALWLPFLLFPVSLITLVAGAAVLFETVPRIVSQATMRFAPGLGFDPLGLGLAFALPPALWFARFDTARQRPGPRPAGAATGPTNGAAADAAPPPRPGGVRSMTPARRGLPFLRLLTGELRVLLSRTSRWWLLGSLALIVAGAVVPVATATTILSPKGGGVFIPALALALG
jgi:hypothetical protein